MANLLFLTNVACCGVHFAVTHEEDLNYTWSNLEDVKRLFENAGEAGRGVIFTVDQ